MEIDLPIASRIDEIIASIDESPIPTIVTDNRNDNAILAANDAFLDLTGYASSEVIGRNCRFLGGRRSEPKAKALMRNAVAAGRPAVVELWNYRKDGTSFRNAVMVAPIRDETGETAFFIGTQMAIHEHSSPGLNRNNSRRLALGLTTKQRELLKLMSNGLRDGEIAESLGVGHSAVKRLRGRLFERLEARTLADAIRIGIQAGLTG